MSGARGGGWVFSARTDLAVFGGPLLASAVVALVAWRTGTLDAEVPPALFVLLVVVCDVGHVWGTLFRAYLDPDERARRGGLLLAVPLGVLAFGVLLHAQAGAAGFWRVLAYVAAFHFVRQQWGWTAWAGRRDPGATPRDRALDRAAVYAATLWPLLWWHAHLPSAFAWFVDGDFASGLPAAVATAGGVAHAAVMLAWAARQVVRAVRGGGVGWGRVLVVTTTWATWVGGIVALDSDLVFTASNVLAHGVPYVVLVHRWGGARWRGASAAVARLFAPRTLARFVAVLAAFGFVEEALWDAWVWHARADLFPLPALDLSEDALAFVVPLLALPQATHYVLDAFLWRAGRDAPLARAMGFPVSGAPAGPSAPGAAGPGASRPAPSA